MKSRKCPSSGRTRPTARRAVATNAVGRKLMAALDEIIQAERAGGAGLTVREVEIPDRRRRRADFACRFRH